MRRFTHTAGIVLLAVIGLTVAPVSAVTPTAAGVDGTPISSCGAIDTSGTYVLTTDLENAPAEGCLSIEADGVTVDGNGHVIAPGSTPAPGPAIVADGVADASVRELTLTGWRTGLAFRDVDGGSVTETTVSDAVIVGLSIEDASDVELDNNRISGSTGGMRLSGVTDLTARHNTLSALTGTGITVEAGSSDVWLLANDLTSASGGGIEINSAAGVRVEENTVTDAANAAIDVESSTHVTVTGNDLLQTEGVGVRVHDSPGTRTTDNRLVDAALGGIYYVDSGDQTLTHRQAIRAWLTSMDPGLDTASTWVDAGQGPSEEWSMVNRDALVANNTVRESFNHGVSANSTPGLEVIGNTVSGADDGISVHNNSFVTIRGNHLTQNRDDGLVIDSASNSTASGNNASRNGDNGIYVIGDDNVLLENLALENGDDGLDLQNSTGTVVRNNTFMRNVDDGMFSRESYTATVASNVMRHNEDDGVDLRRSDNNTIVNNSVCQNLNYDLQIRATAQNNEVANNEC